MAKNPFGFGNNPFMKKADKDEKPYGGKETLAEEEKEHGVKLDKPLKAHKGLETPEEEAAEEEEIAALELGEDEGEEEAGETITPDTFVDEVKALLAKLDAPKAPRAGMWSIDEKKLPL